LPTEGSVSPLRKWRKTMNLSELTLEELRQKTEDRPYYLDLKYYGLIYVDYEMFRVYRSFEEAEYKRSVRSGRCKITGENGHLKRCEDDCSQCSLIRSGKDISLDMLYEQYELEFCDNSNDLIDSIQETEKSNYISAAIKKLPDDEQMIIKGCYFDDKKITEIAADLNINERTVRRKRDHALLFLKTELADIDDFL